MRRSVAAAAVLVLTIQGNAVAQQSAARPIPMLVSAEWLSQRLADPDLVVVQVDQRRDGYDAGHIPGAVYLPYARIAGEVEGIPVELLPVESLRQAFEEVGYDDRRTIVLYGAALSAARAWMTLDYLGISDRAAMLDGGMPAWRQEGRPVSTEAPNPRPGRLTIQPRPERIASADWVLARMEDPRTVLIDARPSVEYTGEDNGQNGRYLAGHIPGARHLHWEDLIESTSMPRLLPIESLRQKFEAAGAGADRTVLVYCMVGMRASLAYFVARMLGYDTYFYDGSWADWSARGLPVRTGPDPLATSR
jgi:thiosulfate/3-mercaptopyruvate sulfurtransferase